MLRQRLAELEVLLPPRGAPAPPEPDMNALIRGAARGPFHRGTLDPGATDMNAAIREAAGRRGPC